MLVTPLLFYLPASLSLLGIHAAASQATGEYSLSSAAQCLSNMNEARQAAGLPNLTEKSLFPTSPERIALLTGVCHYMLQEYFDGEPGTEIEGTPALFQFDGQASPDCGAAVKNWQDALRFFEARPPVNNDVSYSVMHPQALSFVALYNPSQGVQGDCQVLVCTTKTAQLQMPSRQTLPAEDLEEQPQNAEPEKEGERESPPSGAGDNAGKTASALLCLTSPDAFGNNPLFT
ncbi:hypothetical protein Emag_004124 [Eimeria magna]